MKSMIRIAGRGKRGAGRELKNAVQAELNSRVALIQALIPLGLEAVEHALQQEVTALAGERYLRGGGASGLRSLGEAGGVGVSLSDQRVSPIFAHCVPKAGRWSASPKS